MNDDLYCHARIYAARRDTTVTALVRSFLANLGDASEHRSRAILSRLAAYQSATNAHKFSKYLTEAGEVKPGVPYLMVKVLFCMDLHSTIPIKFS